MTLQLEILKDVVITRLGSSIVSTTEAQSETNYSFIELADGRILKNVQIIDALKIGLTDSLNERTPVELHMFANPEDKKALSCIVAFKGKDGRIFGQDVPELSLFLRLLPVGLFIGGIMLLPVFGLGLAVWWMAWKFHKLCQVAKATRAHVLSLPNAILL
jgi:hypothetical protein